MTDKKEDKKIWEIRLAKGILTCTIDLTGPDAVTLGCGVADRIKSFILGQEAKAQMQKQMEDVMKKQTNGIIKPGVMSPGGHA
jgi:hypothetical protein